MLPSCIFPVTFVYLSCIFRVCFRVSFDFRVSILSSIFRVCFRVSFDFRLSFVYLSCMFHACFVYFWYTFRVSFNFLACILRVFFVYLWQSAFSNAQSNDQIKAIIIPSTFEEIFPVLGLYSVEIRIVFLSLQPEIHCVSLQ